MADQWSLSLCLTTNISGHSCRLPISVSTAFTYIHIEFVYVFVCFNYLVCLFLCVCKCTCMCTFLCACVRVLERTFVWWRHVLLASHYALAQKVLPDHANTTARGCVRWEEMSGREWNVCTLCIWATSPLSNNSTRPKLKLGSRCLHE